MPDRSIIAATRKNCVEYQETSAAFHKDAEYLMSEGAFIAAAHAQQASREYHDAAWEHLAQLIGV